MSPTAKIATQSDRKGARATKHLPTDNVDEEMTGSGLAAIATIKMEQNLSNEGNNMMLTGDCFQVAVMVFCGSLILAYAWRRWQNKATSADGGNNSIGAGTALSDSDEPSPEYMTSDEKTRRRTKQFVWALTVAYLAIIIRCIYR